MKSSSKDAAEQDKSSRGSEAQKTDDENKVIWQLCDIHFCCMLIPKSCTACITRRSFLILAV